MERISRSGEGSGLEGIAQFLPDTVTSEALVLSPEVEADLEHLLVRCREREHLPDGLGISTSTRYAPGVRALFTGPTGTGKTLAAAWLASRLGLPLYRVDLASVTSKYIGETEKNLERLLSRAERTEAVLLFDEADSLFGNRTDVRDANDRFANAQTNYLLQRMETFDGIAVLTSNSRARFDTAFARRLDAIIEFPPPAAAQRLSLWQSHLGCAHGLAHGEVSLLANQCDLAGGQIRNVVLAAAVTARTRQAPLALPHVLHALEAEYRKAGRSLPPGLQAARVALPTP
jgi:SpoVK/Ycf46/Vps4 family AAA+-type ATPase